MPALCPSRPPLTGVAFSIFRPPDHGAIALRAFEGSRATIVYMTAGVYLSKLSRKILESGEGHLAEIIGIASGLIDAEKELSTDQMHYIADSIRDLSGDENDSTDLGIGLAKLIRDWVFGDSQPVDSIQNDYR